MNRSLARLATAVTSFALVGTTAVLTAPAAHADPTIVIGGREIHVTEPTVDDPTTVCPNGQTGVFIPPGDYPVPVPALGTVSVGGYWVPLVTVETASGPTTVYLQVPEVTVNDPITGVVIDVGEPGIGVCATPGTPTVYAGVPFPVTSGGTVPSLFVGTGVATLVWPDNAYCADSVPPETITLIVRVTVDGGHCYTSVYVGP